MASKGGILKRLGRPRVTARWAETAARVQSCDPATLRQHRDVARAVRPHIEAILRTAEDRLSAMPAAAIKLPAPAGSDWVWRPDTWSGAINLTGLAPVTPRSKFGQDISVFHDCPKSEITARHQRNTSDRDIAPYGLSLDVLEFSGGFLSVIVDLPEDGASGLTRDHVLQLDGKFDVETPIDLFARLNVRHGPNTEQMTQEVILKNGIASAEFDLAYSNVNEKRTEQAWIDLIFENPRMNRIVMRDLILSRRVRAAL